MSRAGPQKIRRGGEADEEAEEEEAEEEDAEEEAEDLDQEPDEERIGDITIPDLD